MVSSGNKAMLVEQLNTIKQCAFCNKDLDIEEGVMIYNKNWYHNGCWNTFENQQELE